MDDLEKAARRWADVGVGPFIHLEHPEFDVVESEGRPAVFDHSGAFGMPLFLRCEFEPIEDRLHYAPPGRWSVPPPR